MTRQEPAMLANLATPTALPLSTLQGLDKPWRYALNYWVGTVRNLTRAHRLAAHKRPSRSAPVVITEAQRTAWLSLFGSERQAQAPLLFNQRVGTLLYTQLFSDMRINFRHLLHLQHDVEHVAGPAACAASLEQELVCRVSDVRRVFGNKAVITVCTEVRQALQLGGALLAVIQDRFLIRELPPADLDGLDTDRNLMRLLMGLRRRRPTVGPASPQVWSEAIALPKDLGRRYGRVSGDCNPVHTTTWVARLFGQKRPFAQGLALRNAVVARLSALGVEMGRFEMTFASPAWLGQTLELRLSEGRFELIGSQGELVAFGETGQA
jgi:hypothetical protein